MTTLIRHLVPNYLLESAYDSLLQLKFGHLTRRNTKLRQLKRHDRAFILGTGPSLKLENLRSLKGEDCYSVSNFYLHPDLSAVNPKLHFFAPHHPPLILNNYIDWLKQADAKLPKSTKICLGHPTKPQVVKHQLFPKREIYYLTLSPARTIPQVDITRPILSPQSGPLMILPVLLYLGYREIYLLGCDHNVLMYYGETTENFYDPKDDVRVNATDKGSWGEIIPMLNNNLVMFKQYQAYQDLATNLGITITNLSQGSWLDFVPQARLSHILGQ